MTPSDTPSTPASAPRTGAAGGAAPGCGELAGTYLRLVEAIRASATRGNERAEDRLRNRAQVVLSRMRVLGCLIPNLTDLEP